ncbi:MAG: DUF3365 domain-containing protein [Chlorobi bacterium]|nr:DUF3365 domain-containing protein [Chlorobiota bacterium]
MKKLLFITGLLIMLAACRGGEKEQPEGEHQKTQLEINKENADREEGDHVESAAEIPPLTPEEKQQYLDTAKAIAKEAFGIFSGHLNRLFAEKHPVEALEYCKQNAMRITDSLSKVHGVTIKRTSYRLRNPDNAPTDQEEKIMEIYRHRIHRNLKPEPYVHYDNYGYPHVYIPIMVQEKCLMCHGDPNKDIPDEINNKLAELYPGDKAIFFKPGDLRGIWSIKFPKKHGSDQSGN